MKIKNWIKKGYVSIEAVIVGAIILSAGFAALSSLSVNGSAVVQNSLNKLDALGVFNTVDDVQEPAPEPEPEVVPYVYSMMSQHFGLGDTQFVVVSTGEQYNIPSWMVTAAVRLDITNNTTETMYVKDAQILRNGIEQGEVMSAGVAYMGTENLMMKDILPGTSGNAYLFFEMDQSVVNFTTTPKSELQLVLTLMNDEVVVLEGLIGN